jgi:hypothetical protein
MNSQALQHYRARRDDRRQRRTWRRERQKTTINAHDAVNQAQSSLYNGHGFFTD